MYEAAMDPSTCDRLPPESRGSIHLLGRQQAAQAARANEGARTDFEQRLGEAAAEASIASDTPRPAYPHLSSEDENLIEAVKTSAVRRNVQEQTARNYACSLRKLGNHLVSRGKTISGLDHASLLDHAWLYFPADQQMRHAVGALRKHRDSRVADAPRHYVPPSEDKSLIDGAIQAAAARRGWLPSTVMKYDRILRRIAKSLESQKQTIAALDHNSLVGHVKRTFGSDNEMDDALMVLREHREHDTRPARRVREDHPPAVEDKRLIEAAAGASGRSKKAVGVYVKNLLRFAGTLNANGQRMTNFEYPELVKLAKGLFPGNKSIIAGLGMIRDYRNAESASGSGAPWPAGDDLAVASPELSFDANELWRILEDRAVPSLPLHSSVGLEDASNEPDRLRAETMNTAPLLVSDSSRVGHPSDRVSQPGPTDTSPELSFDQDELWRILEDQPMPLLPLHNSAGLPDNSNELDWLRAETLNTATLLVSDSSRAGHPSDRVSQPGPAVTSPELSFDQDELWRILDDQLMPLLPLHNSAGLRDRPS
ncbi:hypothetical protein BRAO285_2240003 [Bradyrhizobium sp. ORS 285]|nr:hypothetical protein BRAO285_2240003 [Bradyrhizobium sp. ORS 285]